MADQAVTIPSTTTFLAGVYPRENRDEDDGVEITYF